MTPSPPVLSEASTPDRREGVSRRTWLAGALMAGGWRTGAAQGEPPALVFLGFELIDEQPDPARAPALRQRLDAIDRQMADGLAARGLYRLVELGPARALVAKARDENEFIYRCNGCLAGPAAALGVRLVGTGWVQRVSNLILNINFQVQEVSEDRLVLTKSVDIRGDNEEAWRRGVAYLLRDMVERRERQPGYGR